MEGVGTSVMAIESQHGGTGKRKQNKNALFNIL
jgi:hypothetical protein